MRRTLVLVALAGTFVMVGCDRASDSDSAPAAEAQPQPQVNEGTTQAPPRKRVARPEPDSEAVPLPTDAAAAAADEPKEPLRFDMTQDGQAQTAEEFEAWMGEQGVRVAEGSDAKATAGAQGGAAVKAADTRAKTTQTGTDRTPR